MRKIDSAYPKRKNKFPNVRNSITNRHTATALPTATCGESALVKAAEILIPFGERGVEFGFSRDWPTGGFGYHFRRNRRTMESEMEGFAAGLSFNLADVEDHRFDEPSNLD